MPIIKIEFDNDKVTEDKILELSEAIQKIVVDLTQIEDVFVYANSALIKVMVAPIEIFVEMTAPKIKDASELITSMKDRLIEWKKENNYPHLINLTLIPMEWKIEIGI